MGNDSDSGSGHGFIDHVGEAGDIGGSAASLIQALDSGGAAGPQSVNPGFLPGTDSIPMIDSVDGLALPLEQGRGFSNLFNGIGFATGLFSAATGAMDLFGDDKSVGERVVGAGNLASGGIGAAGSAASFFGASTGVFGGLAQAGGAMGMAGNVATGAAWGTGAASTGAAVGTGLATGGAVLGAGLAGYGLGQYADEHTKDTGWFQDAQGRNQSMTDEVADAGVAMDERYENAIGGEQGSFQHGFGDVVGDLAGLSTVALGSIAGTLAAPTIAAHGIGSSLWNWARGRQEP